VAGSIAALIYGAIAAAGGWIGYRKAGSKVSLWSGLASGACLIFGGALGALGQPWGLWLAVIVTGVLVVVFVVRLLKTRKLMPAGMMVVLGAIALAVLVGQLRGAS